MPLDGCQPVSKLLDVTNTFYMETTATGSFLWRRETFGVGRRYMGRCGCKRPVSALVLSVVHSRKWSFGETDTAAHEYVNGILYVPCPCGRVPVLRPIKGIIRKDKPCNAKCLSGTGGTCECSCGGVNHGASHG